MWQRESEPMKGDLPQGANDKLLNRFRVAMASRLLRSGWSPLGLSLASGLLVWAALPPLNLWWLAWIAPLGYILLVRMAFPPGRHPYAGIYVASVLCWILTMQGIRLAHWANYLGLVALALYLGVYVPLFVAVSRVMHHRWRLPLVISAPVAWGGMEVVRGYGPLGFSMALLGHTQVEQPVLIQVSDLFGPYTVGFAIMLVAAALAELMVRRERTVPKWRLAIVVLVPVAMWGYGRYRLAQVPPAQGARPLRVALIQGSIDTEFDNDPDRPRRQYEQYNNLTHRALARFDQLDLIMWPETMFPLREVLHEGSDTPSRGSRWEKQVSGQQRDFNQLLEITARQLEREDGEEHQEDAGESPKWALGTATWEFSDGQPHRYNTALLVDSQGDILGRYYKMHPVIFGEYVPFGDLVPALYRLFPLPNGLTPGRRAVAWNVNGWRLSPSICFESTMPHLIRRHVVELTRRGRPPDVLINLTNDGWFWGSSILDMHLNCAIFQAIQLRRPVLVAANTGFSAWIDGNGIVRAKGPRRATGVCLAEVVPDGRSSGYMRWGDLPAAACALVCAIAAAWGAWAQRRSPR